MHQQAAQRVIEVGLVSDLDILERLRHVECPSGLDTQTQFTEKPGEVKNVLEEIAHSTSKQETGDQEYRREREGYARLLSPDFCLLGRETLARFSSSCTRSP